MTEPLFPYYQDELIYLRKLVDEFAARHPVVARRLQLEPTRSTDAHVERLLETAALLAARVRRRLDDEFPQVTDALLAVLAPHVRAPIPSLAVVQFGLNAASALRYTVGPQSRLLTPPVDGVRCVYRTVYPVPLWPIRLTAASFQPPPFAAFPAGAAPPGAAAVLRLQFEVDGPTTLAELTDLRALRLYLDGDDPVVALLYEALFNQALQVVFRPRVPGPGPAPLLRAAPAAALKPVGFEPDDALLPFPPGLAPGYRLLAEFFAFPAKFRFVDLGGWARVPPAGAARQCEVAVFFSRTHRRLEQGVTAATFRLGCTPAVNLLRPPPIELPAAGRAHFPLVPDQDDPHGYEVYAVDAVASADPTTGETTEYPPLWSIRHDAPAGVPYWYAEREAAVGARDRGTDVALHLVDLGLRPAAPRQPVLQVQTTCTNRDLPARLAALGPDLTFELETAAPLTGPTCVRPPTAPRRPPAGRGEAWRFLSHLAPNALSLADAPEGLEAFRDLLRVYAFADPLAGEPGAGGPALPLLDGLVGVRARRAVGRITDEAGSGFGRGLEVTLEFDEDKLAGTGVYLFAAVLERFVAQYAAAAGFCQLVARTRQRGEIKRWPPRPGQQPPL